MIVKIKSLACEHSMYYNTILNFISGEDKIASTLLVLLSCRNTWDHLYWNLDVKS